MDELESKKKIEEDEEELDEDDDFSVIIPHDIFHVIFVWFIAMSHPAFFKEDLKGIVLTCTTFKLIVDRIMQNEEKYLPKVYSSTRELFRLDESHTFLINEMDHTGPFTARFVIKKLFKHRQSSVDILTSKNGALKIRQFSNKPFIGYTRFGGYDKAFQNASVDLLSSEDWNVVTFSFDGDIMNIFINDKRVDQEVIRGGVLPLSNLGARSHELKFSFMGPMMEMTIWNDCLPTDKIIKNTYALPNIASERHKRRVIGNWLFPCLKERSKGDIIIEKIKYER